MRSAAWFANSSISLHGCRSHYGRQATNRVQHCFFFSNVSSGYPNVQYAVVGGVDAISRAHAEGPCRHLFCFASARRCVTRQPHKQHTEQPVGGFVCVGASCVSSQSRERSCPRMVRTQSNAQLSLIVQCRVLRHPRPRMLRSVSEIGLHGGPLSGARWFLLCFLMIVRGCSPHVGANQCPRNWRT